MKRDVIKTNSEVEYDRLNSLVATFNKFADEASGTIGVDEMHWVLASVGVNADPKAVRRVVDIVAPIHEDQLNRQEFIAFFDHARGLQRLHGSLQQDQRKKKWLKKIGIVYYLILFVTCVMCILVLASSDENNDAASTGAAISGALLLCSVCGGIAWPLCHLRWVRWLDYVRESDYKSAVEPSKPQLRSPAPRRGPVSSPQHSKSRIGQANRAPAQFDVWDYDPPPARAESSGATPKSTRSPTSRRASARGSAEVKGAMNSLYEEPSGRVPLDICSPMCVEISPETRGKQRTLRKSVSSSDATGDATNGTGAAHALGVRDAKGGYRRPTSARPQREPPPTYDQSPTAEEVSLPAREFAPCKRGTKWSRKKKFGTKQHVVKTNNGNSKRAKAQERTDSQDNESVASTPGAGYHSWQYRDARATMADARPNTFNAMYSTTVRYAPTSDPVEGDSHTESESSGVDLD